jgi:alcohol dehydrogenase class IV
VSFEFATANRVLFGAGTLAEAAPLLRGLEVGRALLVTGRNPERAEPVRSALRAVGIAAVERAVTGEPTVDDARAGVEQARAESCQAVIAVGGGSVIDAAKAIAGLATNPGDPMEYLEVIGRGRALERPALPLVAIPTTAGTGSEVTRNAVLRAPEQRVKVSLRSPHLLPRLAIVDPELLSAAPPAVLMASGLDALSQLIEPFISGRANPVTDSLAREGMRRSAGALRRAVLEGTDPARREDLALASLLGGLCLANAGLGAVHGFAAPAGGMFAAPHGAVCAALLAPALEVNLRALRARAAAHPSLRRLDEVAALLTGRPQAGADDAVTWVQALVRDLAVPGLAAYGMTGADVPDLVARAKVASSMKGNPIPLTDPELQQIAEAALAPA